MEEYVRAAHDSAPDSVWLDVIERFPSMREWVANNKTVSTDILKRLLQDPDHRVRFALACVNRLTPEMIDALAADADESIRAHICRHKRCPLALLERLAKNPSQWVAAHAQEALKERARVQGRH
jgi:hypothetical protein